MKGDAGFAMKSFKVGDQFVPHVGVTCCGCGKTHWRKSTAKGLGNRIFHNEGWLLGTRRTSDKCPDCRGAKRGEGMTPGEKRKAYLAIDKRDRRKAGENVERIEPQQAPEPVIVNTVMAEKLAPVLEQMKEEGVKERERGGRGHFMERGFTAKSNAKKSAKWAVKRDRGRTDAVEGVDYEIINEDGGTYGWKLLDAKQKEAEQMADDAGGLIVKAAAEPPRTPTREDNRRIIDALDGRYDQTREFYRGDWSDAKLATDLDVPRAWVADIRERVYGPDRNEAQQAETKELREAIAMAEQAVKTLTDMAIEAENLARNLRGRAAKLMAA